MADVVRHGLHPVNVIFDEPGAQVGDDTGFSFIALVSSIPRCGDRIVLDDGRSCDVIRVIYKSSTRRDDAGKAASIMLVPNVVATLLPDKAQD